jgi:charged multivesicular body protein 7
MWKKIEGDYVMLGLVEQAADTLDKLRDGVGISPADNLYTIEEFRREFGANVIPEVVLSETDIKVLIKYLERERRVIVQDGDVCSQNVMCVYLPTDITLRSLNS